MSITLTEIREQGEKGVKEGEARSFTTWLEDAELSLTGERVQAPPPHVRQGWVR